MRRSKPATLLILMFAAATMLLTGCGKSRDLPNIILISVDTLRADHMSCYGYEKKTTPMIDNLAKRGVRFKNAYSTSPWTLPSHGSMFSGLYPSKHHAIDENVALDKAIPLLTEKLQSAGYETGAFVSHYYLSKDYGFNRGFDKFVLRLDAPAEEMTEVASRWIRDNRKKNFFAFIHYFDPHTPYTPSINFQKKYYPPDIAKINGDTKDVLSVVHTKDPEERKRTLRALTALYDGEIDYTDSAIGELYKKLQLFKLEQNTLIVVVSDHGEEFYEHGLMEHGFTLYNEQIHVPMVFHCPGKISAGKVIDTPVSLIDLMPTLMEYAGLQPPREVDGSSLMPFLREAAAAPEQLTKRDLQAQTTRQGPDRMCMIRDDRKYIYSPDFKLSYRRFGPELFNLQTDPKEKTNLVSTKPELAAQYKKGMMDSGMYVPKKVWHVRFGGTTDDTRYNGHVSSLHRIIATYKDNVIYDTDDQRQMISREFPWRKTESKIQFVAFAKDGENGFSFITDPDDAQINLFLFVDNKEHPEKINIGKIGNHPEKIPFTLEGDIPKEAKEPPAGGYLIWSTEEYVNSGIVLRFEVGDQVQPSKEMKERLRSLGYIGG